MTKRELINLLEASELPDGAEVFFYDYSRDSYMKTSIEGVSSCGPEIHLESE